MKHVTQNWPCFLQVGGPRSTTHAHLNAQKGMSHKNPNWHPSHGKTQFLCDGVECQPDSELWEICGVEVSVQTIAHSLQWEGYTMKMVHHSFYWIVVTIQRIVAGLDLSRPGVECSACSEISLPCRCKATSQTGSVFV